MQNFHDLKTISGFFLCNNNFYSKKGDHFENLPIKKRDSRKPAPYIQIHYKAVGKGWVAVGDYNCIPAFGSSVK